jgi:hypothetical protein
LSGPEFFERLAKTSMKTHFLNYALLEVDNPSKEVEIGALETSIDIPYWPRKGRSFQTFCLGVRPFYEYSVAIQHRHDVESQHDIVDG